MKHFKISFLLTLLMSMVSIQSFAYDAEVDGIYFDISGNSAIVTYHDDLDEDDEDHEEYEGNIVIPSSITYGGRTYNVAGIGGYAFQDCSRLTSIEIPNSVTSIGVNAFCGCLGLEIIIVDNSNSKYDSRGNCNAIVETESNTLVAGCKNTFILNSVTSIGKGAFIGCTGLTSIDIPNSVTSIGDYAFSGCTGLTSVKIPNNVTSIGEGVFMRCNGLISVKIPNSVTSIGYDAFYGCSRLPSVEIPNSVTSIGDKAFENCSGLTFIEIPNSVTSIGNGAFHACTSLTSIEIPNDVKSIGNGVFENCTSLTSIEIPNSVTSIGNNVFLGCSGLTSIEIPNSVTSIGSSAFYNTPWYNNQPDGLVYAGKVAYKYKGTMPSGTSIVLEEGAKGIADNAFDGCSGLTAIEIPNSVTNVGNSAFRECTGLTAVEIPNSVMSIGNSAFSGCTGLTAIEIPNSVTSIGDHAFLSCIRLTSIDIPNSVLTIGNYAFFQCRDLTTVTANNEVPISIKHDVFSTAQYATLYVPEGSIDAYKTASVWKYFKEIKAINVSVTGITLNESTINFNLIGETMQLTATVLPIEATNKNVNWTSANSNICTVSASGLVTATGEGECQVIATTADGGYTAYCTVNVTLVAPNVAVTGITLSPSVLNFKHVGGTKQIVANVLPADATNKSVNWMSATPTVCSVSETGLVTALGSGNGIVIATTVDGGKMAYCTVNVTPTDHATITMGSNGIATFSDEDALDFTSVSGLKAYIGSGYNPATGDLTMTRVYKVPAGEGLLLKGAAGSYDVPYEETSAYYANLLVGVPTAMTVNPTEGDYTNFILSKDEVKGIGFYPLASAGEIGANKAYLQLPTSILPAAARTLRMVFEDEEEEVTGISASLNDKSEMINDKAVYDLQGRRVMKPTRGLYIKNGKKIMVK